MYTVNFWNVLKKQDMHENILHCRWLVRQYWLRLVFRNGRIQQ